MNIYSGFWDVLLDLFFAFSINHRVIVIKDAKKRTRRPYGVRPSAGRRRPANIENPDSDSQAWAVEGTWSFEPKLKS